MLLALAIRIFLLRHKVGWFVCLFATLRTEFHKVFVAITEEAASGLMGWRGGTGIGENIWITTHDMDFCLFVCLNTNFFTSQAESFV